MRYTIIDRVKIYLFQKTLLIRERCGVKIYLFNNVFSLVDWRVGYRQSYNVFLGLWKVEYVLVILYVNI